MSSIPLHGTPSLIKSLKLSKQTQMLTKMVHVDLKLRYMQYSNIKNMTCYNVSTINGVCSKRLLTYTSVLEKNLIPRYLTLGRYLFWAFPCMFGHDQCISFSWPCKTLVVTTCKINKTSYFGQFHNVYSSWAWLYMQYFYWNRRNFLVKMMVLAMKCNLWFTISNFHFTFKEGIWLRWIKLIILCQ